VPFVYILRCVDASLYVGVTTDVARRLRQHNAGVAAAYTASRRPVAVVFSEEHSTLSAALSREHQLKRWTRKKKLALIAGDPALLKRL
jgi:predicted GIY-YIG superfamily endonuclease